MYFELTWVTLLLEKIFSWQTGQCAVYFPLRQLWSSKTFISMHIPQPSQWRKLSRPPTLQNPHSSQCQGSSPAFIHKLQMSQWYSPNWMLHLTQVFLSWQKSSEYESVSQNMVTYMARAPNFSFQPENTYVLLLWRVKHRRHMISLIAYRSIVWCTSSPVSVIEDMMELILPRFENLGIAPDFPFIFCGTCSDLFSLLWSSLKMGTFKWSHSSWHRRHPNTIPQQGLIMEQFRS